MKASDLIRRIKQLAKQYPNAVYRSSCGDLCYYTKGRTKHGPSRKGCLIGQGLRDIGVKIVERTGHNTKFVLSKHKTVIGYGETPSIGSLLSDLFPRASRTQRLWLINVQSRQDGGATWSEVVKYANQYAKTEYNAAC